MRILLVSWEYPPVVVGGLGRHVGALATHLAAQGHDVVVLTRQPTGTDASTHPSTDAVVDGVRVLRVAEDPPHLEFVRDLVAWTLAMNHALLRTAAGLLREWRPEVVHAHDWLVAHAAITLRELADVPLVATIHATEAGRHGGWLSQPLNQQVHSVEWWLANAADAVVTCSRAMRTEVADLFDVDPDRVTVLHNGIDARGWAPSPVAPTPLAPTPLAPSPVAPSPVAGKRRRRHPVAENPHRRSGPPTLVTFGRLEWEKGIQDVIAALPAIRRAHPGTRLMIAGSGSHASWLAARAREARVRRAVVMLGHVDDTTLTRLLGTASAVVLPSRYEPFGIVALEAAAAGAPLVASRAGGLGEVVLDGVTGLSFDPGDVAGCAAAVIAALDDPEASRRRAATARERLDTDFAWPTIAADTAALYRATRRRDEAPLERPKIPGGNVFGRT